MKGFKPSMKMAHGGKVRYAEGGLSDKLGPPDNSERGGRRGMESEAAQKARAKEKSKSAVKSAARAIKEIDPKLGYVGNVRNIVKKQYDMMDAFRGSDRASSETGYKKGGKVQKVMREFKAGELHSGSKKGPVVKDRKQAIAIALSEAGKSKKG